MPLRAGDAVAALIVLDDGRYLMQKRDDLPAIWYPGHWGLFGGGVDAGETDVEAMARELEEEIELTVPPEAFTPFTRFVFDLTTLGDRVVYRTYFRMVLPVGILDTIHLREGAAVAAFSAAEILGGTLPVTPYDSFALWLDFGRARLGHG